MHDRTRALILNVLLIGLGNVCTEAAMKCPVSIALGGTEFSNSVAVHPVLVTTGSHIIFLPVRGQFKGGYRLQRVTSDPELEELTRTGLALHETRALQYPSTRYDLRTQGSLPISWKDVGEPGASGGDSFVVQPGTYRLTIEYALSDPSKSRKLTSLLCVSYSNVFRLMQASSWTTFQ